ncbi:ribosome biogenesis GTPase Der [Spirochaeta lutea]|uniref:ribosome biogenesis GTPase Der n=1 Tax=Spirochaeta lutea TaxID=1480694 RepID=UPI00068C78BE|nr:ribosome biogenesis GTPase Der [Spirochaeta lutea]
MILPTSDAERLVQRLPRVAIVGRPNVGKSTLFNRLIRKRKSITDPTPGVTRDPVSETTILGNRKLEVIDTGGLTESREFLDRLITQRSFSAMEQADVLVFVLDVTELTPEDEEFINRLRQFRDRLILAVNKVDNPTRELEAYNFLSLGFDSVFPLSAAHGAGVEELVEEILRRIPQLPVPERISEDGNDQESQINRVTADKESESDGFDISIALLGQPNTGKSTLINRLTGADTSIVSPVAGTTRDVVQGSFEYKQRTFRILDTAGIRRKSRVEEDLEYYSVNRAFKSIEDADVVILMIDVDKGLVEQDKKIAAQIVKKGRGVVLAANKWDTLEDTPNTLRAVTDRIRFLFPVLEFAPILPLSALEGQGIPKLLNTVIQLRTQLEKRIDTGTLNNALARWIERTPPPQNKKHRWKLRYITQVSKHPVQFILFVNKTKGFPESYLGYIRNSIRREFGFTNIPISVELRDRR